MIAFFSQRDDGQGGLFTDEFSGNSQYACVEDNDGFHVLVHDSGGQGSTRVFPFNTSGVRQAQRTVDTKLASAMMGQGACWDVWNNGTGNDYEDLLQEAKDVLGI